MSNKTQLQENNATLEHVLAQLETMPTTEDCMREIDNTNVTVDRHTNEIEELQNNKADKNEMVDIVFGVYTGDKTSERFINLGFTPVAVELYRYDGGQYCDGSWYVGGLAYLNYPCTTNPNGTYKIFEVTTNGFNVFYNSGQKIYSNDNKPFYFKAYKNGPIKVVE